MNLPPKYAWLTALSLPRTINEALKCYGLKETVGAGNNPAILGWAHDLGVEKTYTADSIPWCGLFVGAMIQRAGWYPVATPLWARAWANFGVASNPPALGDVLVFKRDGGGHVGFYIAEDEDTYHVLGGNQGDMVSIVRIAKPRLVASRRPVWRSAQPESVKPYHLASNGVLSTNEA